MEKTSFKRRKGTSGVRGQLYEVNMIMIVYLECLISYKSGKISRFLIGTNVEGCGDLDDVVVKLNYKEDGREKCRRYFIQAKIRENETKKRTNMHDLLSNNKKQGFALKKYLESFENIRNQLPKENPKLASDSDKTDYILYTNNIYNKLQIDSVVRLTNQEFRTPIELPSKKGDKNYEIENIENRHRDEEFWNNFKLLFGKPNEKDLEIKIKEKLSSQYELSDPTSLFNEVQKRIVGWWEGGEYLLDETEDFFLETLFAEMTNFGIKKLLDFNVTFCAEAIDDLAKRVGENIIMHIKTDKDAKFLHTKKICQTLDKMKLGFYLCNSKSHLINQVSVAFGDKIKCLLVELEGDFSDIQLLVDTIINQNKKLIIISERSVELKINECFVMEASRFQLADFDRETLTALKTKLVTVQGREVKLGSFISDEGFNSHLLIKIIKQEPVVIGKRMTYFDKIRKSYVERTFSRLGRCDIKCLDDQNLILAISGWNQDRIKKLDKKKFGIDEFGNKTDSRLFLLCDSNEKFEFSQLLSKYPSIHWLRFDDSEHPLWLRSGERIRKLRKYMLSDNKEYKCNELVENEDGQFMIMVAEAGMGKSTCVAKYADTSFETNRFLWIVRIDLNKRKKFLKNMKEINSENVYNFIAETLTLESDCERELFRYSYFDDGKILLLFDGFDEICNAYKDDVLKIFRILKESKITKIIVTTRLHECENLEDELNTFAFGLCPYSLEKTYDIFKSFFLNQFKLDVMKMTRKKREEWDAALSFYKNPLNMLLFLDFVVTKFEKGEHTNLKQNNRLEMYESLVRRKFYLIYCETKEYVNDEELRDTCYLDFVRAHKQLAMVELFDYEHLAQLDIAKAPEDADKWFKAGLVTREGDGDPVMVHRTFAEYFAALALHEAFHNKRKSTIDFFERVDFYSDKYKDVRSFFDMRFAREVPINMAVLNRDTKALIELASKGDITSSDTAGRTALHLAISYRDTVACGILIRHGAEVMTVDNIYGWTPIEYALYYKFEVVIHPIMLLDLGNNDYTALPNKNIKTTISKFRGSLTRFIVIEFIQVSKELGDNDEAIKAIFEYMDAIEDGKKLLGRDPLWINPIKNDYIWVNTVIRMLKRNRSWSRIYKTMLTARINQPPPESYVDEAVETLFMRALFVHEVLKEETLHDKSLKIAISDWNEDIFNRFPSQESIFNCKDTEIDSITDLNSFRVFLLSDTNAKVEYEKICKKLGRSQKMVWIQSKDLKIMHQCRTTNDIYYVDNRTTYIKRRLHEVLDDGDKISIMQNDLLPPGVCVNNFPLCRNMLDLRTIDIELNDVNEISVQDYILKSLFLKRGAEINAFHEYFSDGRTMLIFEELIETDHEQQKHLNRLIMIMQQKKALKFCIKTSSKILLYNLNDPSMIDQNARIDCVDLSHLIELTEEHSPYFDVEKINLAFDKWKNSPPNFNRMVYIIINSMEANVCATIDPHLNKTWSFDLKSDDQFLKIQFNWETMENILMMNTDESVYSFLHRNFVSECKKKCSNLVNDPKEVLQLTKFPMKHKSNHESAIRFIEVLRRMNLGKIIIMCERYTGLKFNTFQSFIELSTEEINKILKQRLSQNLKSKEQMLLDTLTDYVLEFDVTPLTLDTLLYRISNLTENYEKMEYGVELVFLLSETMMSDHGPEWQGMTRWALKI